MLQMVRTLAQFSIALEEMQENGESVSDDSGGGGGGGGTGDEVSDRGTAGEPGGNGNANGGSGVIQTSSEVAVFVLGMLAVMLCLHDLPPEIPFILLGWLDTFYVTQGMGNGDLSHLLGHVLAFLLSSGPARSLSFQHQVAAQPSHPFNRIIGDHNGPAVNQGITSIVSKLHILPSTTCSNVCICLCERGL